MTPSSNSLPAMSAEDRALLTSAVARAPETLLADLTAPALRDIAAQRGIDFATALLYNRVLRTPQHAEFIAQIDELQNTTPLLTAPDDVLLGIVPAAFYQQMPHAGADGRVVRETAAQLRIPCELVPLRSAGTLAENAAALCAWLMRHRDRRILLVSLCKGGADVKHALRVPGAGACFRHVFAWVNVCGTLDGSPLAQWLLTTKPRFIAAWLYFKCHGHDFDLLREIVPSRTGTLAAPLALPETLPLISVIGFPLRRHLSNGFMRRCHTFIAPQGPNDGGVLLADACRLPGRLYPVWGADHYLRPDDRARAILAAVFTHVMQRRPAPVLARV